MNVLFVCTGNTCRSPMAEALLKNKDPRIEVCSAGIFAGHGQPANQTAMEVLRQKNISMEHRSQPVTGELLEWADLVLTMTTGHKQSLILEYPDFQDKYFTLKEYVSDADHNNWQKLQRARTAYEEKRSVYIQNHQHEMNKEELEKKLTAHLQEDLQRIQQLETSLIDYDIPDPIGGDLSVYQNSLLEMDDYADLLIKKINNHLS